VQIRGAERLPAACQGIDDGEALAGQAFHALMLMQLHWH
jgi:hypothetical protein